MPDLFQCRPDRATGHRPPRRLSLGLSAGLALGLSLGLPASCAGCGRWETTLCPQCRELLEGEPFSVEHADAAGDLDVLALATYTGPIRAMVLGWKNGSREDLAEAMDNVVVLIQDEPDPEMLTEEDYDEAGLPTLLGLYDGVPLTERDEGWSMVLPDRILIFRGPLERWCTSREELVEEITVTVIHEVAHHFGIPDERLHELGWE